MDFDDDLTLEEMIFEDVKEWVTYNILETQTWNEYMETLSQKNTVKKLLNLWKFIGEIIFFRLTSTK
jgi:hypothetical protein